MGGRIPRASQVRRIMLLGWFVDKQGILALEIYSIGYALGGISNGARKSPSLNIPASVLGQGSIVVINKTSLWAEDNVLED